MREYLLGIDIGTSACKVALFDRDGNVAGQASEAYPVYYPKVGWAEQDPEQWWQAVCKALKRLSEQSPKEIAEVVGIGVDGQSWSAIAMDRSGKLLRRTPIWMDTRGQSICRELERRLGTDHIFSVSGNPLQSTYALPKVLWYQQEEPELYRQIAKILQSNSYIVWKLTGELSQDYSQCYGFQCYNMRSGTWDEGLCREMGIDTALFPPLVQSSQVVGTVTEEASTQTGLRPGIPVVAGGLDAACGTLGAGVIDDGETQEQGGQAGGMSICLSEYRADPRLILSNHVVPGKWLLQGGTTGGCGVENWLSREFAAAEQAAGNASGTSVFAEMDKLAAGIPCGSEGLVFLPYMAGERSPIWNPNAKGVFFGLDFSKTRGHVYRAAMEGVAYALRHNLETAAHAGGDVKIMHTMGGAANSALWTQMKADITGIPIATAQSDTATTLGAAILGGVAVGVYSDFREAVRKTVRIRRHYAPRPETGEIYQKGYETYLGLYDRLRDLM